MADETQELQIKVRVDADTGKLQVVDAQLQKIGKTNKENAASAKAATKSNQEFTQAINQLGGSAGINVGALTSLAGGITAIAAVIGVGIKEWEDQLAINREVEATVRGLGLSYDGLKGSIDDATASLSKNTRFTQDETTKAFNEALRLTGDYDSAIKLLKISIDASVGTGKSLERTLMIMRQALNSSRGASLILGQEFGKLGTQGNTVSEMLTNLGQNYEGAAEKEKSLTKETSKLKELFENTAEIAGKNLAPTLEFLISVFGKLVGFFSAGIALISRLVTDLFNLVKTEWQTVYYVLTGQFDKVGKAWGKLGTDMGKNWTEFAADMEKTNKSIFGDVNNTQTKIKNVQINSIAELKRKEKEAAEERKKQLEKDEKLKADIYLKQLENEERLNEERLARIRSTAESISQSIAQVVGNSISEMVGQGKSAEEVFGNIGETMKAALINAAVQAFQNYFVQLLVTTLLPGGPVTGTLLGTGLSLFGKAGGIGSAATAGLGPTTIGGIPSLDGGGAITRNGLAYVHRGETIVPNSGSAGNVIIVQALDTRSIATMNLRSSIRRLTPEIAAAQKRR